MNMTDLSTLLKPDLLGVGAAFVIVFQVIWKVFSIANPLPTFPKWLIPLAMIPTAFWLAWTEGHIHPAAPGEPITLASAWAIQGAFLLAVMLGGWLGALAAFDTGMTEPGTPSASKSLGTGLMVGLAMLLLGSTVLPAGADDGVTTLRWSPKRINVGVSGWGVVHDAPQGAAVTSSARADVYAGWNLSRHLSASVGVDHDFSTSSLTNWKAGGSAQLAGFEESENFSLFMGAYYVHRDGEGAAAFQYQDSWEAFLSGAWNVAKTKAGRRWLAVVASGRYDPNNDYPTAMLGLRVQAFGGKP